MGQFHRVALRNTRKEHTCVECRGRIPAGMLTLYGSGIDEDEQWYHYYSHVNCAKAGATVRNTIGEEYPLIDFYLDDPNGIKEILGGMHNAVLARLEENGYPGKRNEGEE